jgi:hypothetical protein
VRRFSDISIGPWFKPEKSTNPWGPIGAPNPPLIPVELGTPFSLLWNTTLSANASGQDGISGGSFSSTLTMSFLEADEKTTVPIFSLSEQKEESSTASA